MKIQKKKKTKFRLTCLRNQNFICFLFFFLINKDQTIWFSCLFDMGMNNL